MAFWAEGAACFVDGVGMRAVGAVGGMSRESVHDIELGLTGEAGYRCWDGTELDLAGSGGERRHCCGWGAASRARWIMW